MLINKINTKNKVMIIAEVGNNHEGSYALADELAGLAIESGADAVKFQTFKTELYVDQSDKNRFEMLKKFELRHKDFEKLSHYTKKSGSLFISTPFDLESADFLENIVDAIKISSGDNNFFPLISKVARMHLPLIMSTGVSDINGIIKSVDFINKIRKDENIRDQLAILHCVSSYPVEPKYANLNAITTLINEFDNLIGYSDHTLGNNAAIGAVTLGARIIEKHFTKDKNFSSFRDHSLSADPVEMKSLVSSIRQIEDMLGSGKKIIQTPEKEIVNLIRRSVVAKHNLKKGNILTLEDITWVRPIGKISPGDEKMILGKKLRKNIQAGSKLCINDFQG